MKFLDEVMTESKSIDHEIIEDLLSENDKLQTITSLAPENLYWKNCNYEYDGCNHNFARICRLPNPSAIIGLTDHDLLTPEQARSILEVDQQVIEEGKTFHDEEAGIDANGNWAYYLTKKVPLYGSNNEIIGLLGISMNITKQKEQEAALIAAKEEAKRNNLLKTKFLNNIRHDIRTPFSGIHGILELLMLEEKSPEKQKIIEMCLKSINNLLQYCNSMLETSVHLDQNDVHQLETFQVDELCGQIIDTFKPAALQNNIDLKYKIAKSFPNQLHYYRQALYRVLSNLVDNAIKFSKNGSVQLLVHQNDQNELLVEVIDTGIGIPEDKKEEVFEKFAKLNPSHKNNDSGLGLGLYFIKEISDQIDLKIKIRDNHPQGTIFTLTLTGGTTNEEP